MKLGNKYGGVTNKNKLLFYTVLLTKENVRTFAHNHFSLNVPGDFFVR